MDWKRAKNILIIAFTILNICLFGVLYASTKEQVVSEQTINNTKRILEKNNVLIECPIPKEIVNDYQLKYEELPINKENVAQWLLGNNYTIISRDKYIAGNKTLIFQSNSGFSYSDLMPQGEVYISSKESVEMMLNKFFGKSNLPFNQFKLDRFYPKVKTDTNAKMVYKGIYKGRTVFDNYIDVELSTSGICSIKYNYKKPMQITDRKVKVLPSFSILINKMTNMPGVEIKQVDLGFKGYTNVDEGTKTLYEGLAWRVLTPEGTEYYFNARTGEEIL